MNRRGLIAWSLLAVAFAGAAFALIVTVGQPQPVQGATLYAENCAACHGADLEGQANWQTRLPNGRMPAPPHDATGHTWHHADQDLLVIVRDGLQAIVPGYETDMPAFAGLLSEAEIVVILEYIKARWPAEERQYQAERTAARAAQLADEGG